MHVCSIGANLTETVMFLFGDYHILYVILILTETEYNLCCFNCVNYLRNYIVFVFVSFSLNNFKIMPLEFTEAKQTLKNHAYLKLRMISIHFSKQNMIQTRNKKRPEKEKNLHILYLISLGRNLCICL